MILRFIRRLTWLFSRYDWDAQGNKYKLDEKGFRKYEKD